MRMQRDLNRRTAVSRCQKSAASEIMSGPVRPVVGRLLAWLRRGDEGQALVELALTLPILMALMMGLFSIGNGMIVNEQLGEAAFAGVEQMASNEGVNNAGTTTQADLCLKAYTAVTTVLSAPAWSTANLNKITYSATLDNAGVTTTVPSSTGSFSCSALSTGLGPKSKATLTLSYPYNWMKIYGSNMGSITMTRQQSVLAY